MEITWKDWILLGCLILLTIRMNNQDKEIVETMSLMLEKSNEIDSLIIDKMKEIQDGKVYPSIDTTGEGTGCPETNSMSDL